MKCFQWYWYRKIWIFLVGARAMLLPIPTFTLVLISLDARYTSLCNFSLLFFTICIIYSIRSYQKQQNLLSCEVKNEKFDIYCLQILFHADIYYILVYFYEHKTKTWFFVLPPLSVCCSKAFFGEWFMEVLRLKIKKKRKRTYQHIVFSSTNNLFKNILVENIPHIASPPVYHEKYINSSSSAAAHFSSPLSLSS